MAFSLLPKQQAFVDSDADCKVLVAGRQAGKTTAGLYEAAESASDGKSVAFVGPRTEYVQNAIKAFEPHGILDEYSLKVFRSKVELPNGGHIHFLSQWDSLMGGRYDLIVVDEINFFRDQHIDTVLANAVVSGRVIATMTPKTVEMQVLKRLRRSGFETFIAPTSSNPRANINFEQYFARDEDGDRPTVRLLRGIECGDHFLNMADGRGKRHHTCILCDFEESYALTESDEFSATAEAYVVGKAVNTACQS